MNNKVIGKKISEINPTNDYIIVALYKNGEITIPKANMVLNEGDKVSILVKTRAVKDVVKTFTK
jgi:trk system potassium uptake protein TrkA